MNNTKKPVSPKNKLSIGGRVGVRWRRGGRVGGGKRREEATPLSFAKGRLLGAKLCSQSSFALFSLFSLSDFSLVRVLVVLYHSK